MRPYRFLPLVYLVLAIGSVACSIFLKPEDRPRDSRADSRSASATTRTAQVDGRTASTSTRGSLSDGRSATTPTRSAPARLNIARGNLPPLGQCRLWFPDRPAARQPRSASCASLEPKVPSGAWLVSRPSDAPRRAQVTVFHDSQPGVVLISRVYDVDSGQCVIEERP